MSVHGKTGTFGYVEVQLPQGLTEKGTAEMPEPEKIKAHEFHYFDSTANGEDCIATKPVTGRSWKCIHASDDHFWGFPHLYYPSDPKFVEWFWKEQKNTFEIAKKHGCANMDKALDRYIIHAVWKRKK